MFELSQHRGAQGSLRHACALYTWISGRSISGILCGVLQLHDESTPASHISDSTFWMAMPGPEFSARCLKFASKVREKLLGLIACSGGGPKRCQS